MNIHAHVGDGILVDSMELESLLRGEDLDC